MRLRRNSLLVRPIIEDNASSIIIPKKIFCDDVKCEIVHAGPGHYSDLGHFIPNDLKKGDILLLDSSNLNEIHNVDGEDLYYVNEYDVRIVLNDA